MLARLLHPPALRSQRSTRCWGTPARPGSNERAVASRPAGSPGGRAGQGCQNLGAAACSTLTRAGTHPCAGVRALIQHCLDPDRPSHAGLDHAPQGCPCWQPAMRRCAHLAPVQPRAAALAEQLHHALEQVVGPAGAKQERGWGEEIGQRADGFACKPTGLGGWSLGGGSAWSDSWFCRARPGSLALRFLRCPRAPPRRAFRRSERCNPPR